MREELRAYIENLFVSAPQTGRIREFKDELMSNIFAKYDDLIAQGRGEEEAYKIAVSSIGDVDELIRELENDKIYNYARIESDRQKSAMIVSVSVGLYIIALAVQILFAVVDGLSPEIGCVLMFVIAAIATSMLIYNTMSRPKYHRADNTVVEEFKEQKHQISQNQQLYRSLTAMMWPLVTVVYFLVSFFFGGWEYTWLIFIIGAALQNVIKLAIELKNQSTDSHQIYRSLTAMMWPLIVVVYFLVSFFFGGWEYTWLIFIIGVALQSILRFVFEMRRR